MQHLKRPIALMLALLMVMVSIPMTVFVASASVNPVAKATLITAPIYTEYKTAPSPDGRGWRSSPRGFYFDPIEPLNSVGETIIREYGPKFQAYCIDHGGKFRGEQLDQYVGYTPKDSTYFMSFSETQQKGILLCSAFGYPSVKWERLVIDGAMQSGDCLEDAVAATQALLWEFNLNTRTGFGLNDRTDDWAYAMVKDDEGTLHTLKTYRHNCYPQILDPDVLYYMIYKLVEASEMNICHFFNEKTFVHRVSECYFKIILVILTFLHVGHIP